MGRPSLESQRGDNRRVMTVWVSFVFISSQMFDIAAPKRLREIAIVINHCLEGF